MEVTIQYQMLYELVGKSEWTDPNEAFVTMTTIVYLIGRNSNGENYYRVDTQMNYNKLN